MSDDYTAIDRLQRAYADVATRKAWAEVPALLTDDAIVTFDTRAGTPFEVQGAVAFAEFGAKAVGIFGFYEYIPLNFVVTIGDDGTAQGRTYSLEVADLLSTGEWIEYYGVYDDSYAHVDGTWRFARRHYRTYGRRTDGRLEKFPLSLQ